MQFFKMIKTVLKSMAEGPVTGMYPVRQREYGKNTRGQIHIDLPNCIYCGICSKKCPTGAIAVSRPERSWEIDRLRCITCNYCVESCPKKCLSMGNQYSGVAIVKEKEVYQDARVPDNPADR